MIAFDLASLSFGTSLLQRLQQFAPELSPRVRKCCLLLSKPFGLGFQYWLKTEKEIPNQSAARIFASATSILKSGRLGSGPAYWLPIPHSWANCQGCYVPFGEDKPFGM